MALAFASTTTLESPRSWPGLASELGARFAERAAAHDRDGTFVTANWRELAEHGVFWMSVPAELGGGGADYPTVVATVRELARHCGSTALALAMHTHPVATNVLKYRRGDAAAGAVLEGFARERLVVAGTGANDWLGSSGEMVPADGGYRVRAHKRFVSGAPGADLFVTSARLEGDGGTEVLHFSIPFRDEGVRIVETWDALGMRGTGSHDVLLEDAFVPAGRVFARRPADAWHPMWDSIVPTALPVIVAAYVGIAEAAADLGVEAGRPKGASAVEAVGELRTQLALARMALEDTVRLQDDYRFTPSPGNTDAVLARKALATRAVQRTVDVAAELVGGVGFSKRHPIERMVRDVRAMHFHPLPERKQRRFSGRVALGLDLADL